METARPAAKTRAGFVALITALMTVVPMIVAPVAMLLGLDRRGGMAQRASNFIFDFGAILILLTIICSIIGFIQGGESRRLALVGISILAIGIGFGFGLPAIGLLIR